MTSIQNETFGKGGAGNVGTHVQRAVEDYPADGMGGTSNTTGRGGVGNIRSGGGHYDASGGHDFVDASGRGGAGNIHEHETWETVASEGTDRHKVQKVTTADKFIGSAQMAIGKMTHNTGMIDKGVTRKTEGSLHTEHAPPSAPLSGEPVHGGQPAELKNRAL
ncbi:hypothetical protein FRC17_000198 [Serendipita sp. 399]|nr:hypothetical protein FRC17_000198 [Serendipita sp. 399]